MKKFLRHLVSHMKSPLGGIFVVVIVCALIFPDVTFAQENQDVNGRIVNIVKLISWLWIIPASVAGKLMTNSLAFGSAFYLDTYLFKMWQFMRTIALYTLGFVFIFKILVIFVKQEELKNIGSLVGKTAIAGLLIPMSWFMMTAIVDFSVVATSAVASLPLQVIKGQWDELEGKLTCYSKVNIKANKTVDIVDLNNDQHVLTFEDVMPSGDSLAGPMIFMGCGMLNLFDFNNLTSKDGDIGDIVFKGGLKLLISFMLVLPMIVLMVVNMMRIFFIWLWAMFGPLIVLDTVFKGPLTNGEGEFTKYFKISNVFGLVFQPVAVVGLMSVAMVLLLGVYGGLTGEKKNNEEPGGLQTILNVEATGTNSGKIGDGVSSEIFADGALFAKASKQRLGGVLGEMIMVLFVIAILRGLMTVGFQASEITRGTAKKMFDMGKMAAGAIPFIPTGKGAVGVGALQMLKEKTKDHYTYKWNRKNAVDNEKLNKMLGLSIRKDGMLSIKDETEIKSQADFKRAARGGNGVSLFQKLKEVNQTKSIPWTFVKQMTEKWLSTGGFEWAKNNQSAWATTHLPETMPENPGDIWTGGKGKNMLAWINGLMASELTGGASAKEIFSAGGGKQQPHTGNFAPTGKKAKS